MSDTHPDLYRLLVERWTPTVQAAVNGVVLRSGFASSPRQDVLNLIQVICQNMIAYGALPMPPAPHTDDQVFLQVEAEAVSAVLARAQAAGPTKLSPELLRGPPAQTAAWYEAVKNGSGTGLPIPPETVPEALAALGPLQPAEQTRLIQGITQALQTPVERPATTPKRRRRGLIVAGLLVGLGVAGALFSRSSGDDLTDTIVQPSLPLPVYRLKILSAPEDAKLGVIDFELQPDAVYAGELSTVAVLKNELNVYQPYPGALVRKAQGEIHAQAVLRAKPHIPVGKWTLIVLLAANVQAIGDPLLAAKAEIPPPGVQRFQYIFRIP